MSNKDDVSISGLSDDKTKVECRLFVTLKAGSVIELSAFHNVTGATIDDKAVLFRLTSDAVIYLQEDLEGEVVMVDDQPPAELIHENADGSLRTATDVEIGVAWQTHQQVALLQQAIQKNEECLREIKSKCNHTVVHDKAGFPQNIRTCVACGNTVLL